ncbi:MAG: hypothetical protein ABJM11_13990 [Marinobacter sp.]|uniref:hypothetical protein n=1 Tax=Marinobacter sp. TaxID=50741 RepID=UPI003297CB07
MIRPVYGLWDNMVRQMEVSAFVPQHGKRFEGPAMVDQFLNWVSSVDCGIDMVSQENYRQPVDHLSA